MAQRKMSIEEYLEREFTPDSRPTKTTIRNWIKKGAIPGIEIGGTYFVFEQITVADKLVERALKRAS